MTESWPVVGFFTCAVAAVLVVFIMRKRRDTAPLHDVGDTHFHEWGDDDKSYGR